MKENSPNVISFDKIAFLQSHVSSQVNGTLRQRAELILPPLNGSRLTLQCNAVRCLSACASFPCIRQTLFTFDDNEIVKATAAPIEEVQLLVSKTILVLPNAVQRQG